MMLTRLKEKGIVTEMPDLDYEDAGAKRKRVLTKDEIKLIFDNASGTTYGLALFMYLMGCRPAEALGAPWSEFDLDRGIWNLPKERTKTRTARSMKVNETVLTWLLSRKSESTSPWVFPSRETKGQTPIDRYNKQWTRLMIKCGISTKVTPYFLRHTFLSECAKKVRDGSLSLVLITKYAGTSIEQFEKTYLHVEGEDTKAVAALMVLEV